jgi:hypothetical protein
MEFAKWGDNRMWRLIIHPDRMTTRAVLRCNRPSSFNDRLGLSQGIITHQGVKPD